jgi:type II secretion system protein E
MTLTKLLIERKLLTPAQLGEVSNLQQAEGLRFDHAILQKGFLTERELLEVMAEQLHLPIVDLEGMEIAPETLKALPSKIVYRQRLMPVALDGDDLKVATGDPFDLYALDDVRMMTGLNIHPVLARREDIETLIKAHYGLGGDTLDELAADELEVERGDGATDDLLEMAQEASVIKLVNEIILEAVNERASDIHIEPYEHSTSIRYRIDGVLHEASIPPQMHRFQAAIISRIKILANLNIAERRIPQDGRIKFNVGGRQIDVRVSVIPMLFGEGVVMRLLDKANVMFTLQELGMSGDINGVFDQLIARPHGIVLVTGPTGSGKTTTLYAALNAIVGSEIKVLTVEDPVEYNLQGVNQIPVDQKVGMTFAAGLRAILRHDPDAVMIGEIRDEETARAAIQASLTGHLVLSTLHTNDAPSAATRLIDMGIEPYLVSSTLAGAMAQRLVRRICPDCKISYRPDPRKTPKDFDLGEDELVWRGEGCDKCRKSGYRGRLGIHELMPMDDELADMIVAQESALNLTRTAVKNGMRLLRGDGWKKVREGTTTLDAVVACTAH